MEEIIVRKAEVRDVKELLILNEQLGYKTTAEKLQASLEDLSGNPEYEIFVAEQTRSKILVGFINAYIMKSIIEEYSYEVLGLVVRDGFRGLNIGVHLLAEIEKIARSKQIRYITLRSNVKREKAHKFYLREGFIIRKSQHAFIKEIGWG